MVTAQQGVLHHGGIENQPRRLERASDSGFDPLGTGHLKQFLTVQSDCPFAAADVAGDDVEHGGLAGPVGSDEPVETGGEVEVNPYQHSVASEGHMKVFDGQRSSGACGIGTRRSSVNDAHSEKSVKVPSLRWRSLTHRLSRSCFGRAAIPLGRISTARMRVMPKIKNSSFWVS